MRVSGAYRCVPYWRWAKGQPCGFGPPVCTENLNPDVLTMKSAQYGARIYDPGSLNLARDRRILGSMTDAFSRRYIVRIVLQNPTQIFLAQDNDVVQTLAPDRSDQPFGKAVLPRRGRCNWLVSDTHGTQSARDDSTVDSIPISDHIARSAIPRKCLGDLTCNPLRRRVGCDADPDEISAIKPNDDEAIQQLKTNGRHYEQIHGGDVRRVVSQKGPLLAARGGKQAPAGLKVMGTSGNISDRVSETERTIRSGGKLLNWKTGV